MSAESPASSRPPQTNSAKDGSGPETAVSENESKPLAELPDPSDKVREFLDEFGEQAHVLMSTEHGQTLRPEAFEEDTEVRKYVTEDGDTEQVEDVVERRALPLWQVVANMLSWHEEYHKSTLRLEYGRESDPTHTLLDVDLENSWFAAYQDQERARLKALERETCGYQTCDECDTRYCTEQDDHATEYVPGRFEEPVVALTGRTASGAGRPPVDHAREIADAWSNGGVRRSLRYVMDKLGLESEQWVRWTQAEPHPGDGANQGYHHTHDIIILDGAATAEDVTAETFREVIESHVAECDHAGAEAHDLDKSPEQWAKGNVETVSVKEVDGEIRESVASYAASYLANEKVDLLERPPEYLAWAATMWATNTRKATGTDSRTHAIEADRCRHKHHEGEQDVAHGEQVTYSDKRGCTAECLMCGSPWDVEQKETLVAAKQVAGPDVAADGGAAGEQTAEQEAEEDLRSRWPSAREAAVVGGQTAQRECDHEEPDTCPLCATETESPNHTVSGDTPIPDTAAPPDGTESVSAGFERPPSWSAKSVIVDGEEYAATGGGLEKKPLDLPNAPVRVASMATDGASELVCQECVSYFGSVTGYVEHGCEHGEVYVAWLPPTDAPAEESVMSYQEFVEVVPDRLLDEDRGGDLDVEPEQAEPQLPEQVHRYCENNPGAAVPEVLGRFGLSPERAESVAELVN